ncbi:oligosaccharide repeat unit polymerase [Nocardioides ungokensis]|uniref:oligosaccharide repeat unit polymerase n=1 Tax=Nocardioides ungokensis TaxID=1643322 RepID=UPI0015DE331A|nr:oligosaccharide repeat unit polymerase [Nocardioides ungokensis]
MSKAEDSRSGQLTGVAVVFIGAALAILTPTFFWVATPNARYNSVGAVVVMVIAGLRLAFLVGAGVQRLVDTTFWTFTYVFLGLAPLVQLRLGVFPNTTPNLPTALFDPALTGVIVGCFAYLAGNHLSGIRAPIASVATPVTLHRNRTLLLAVVALLAGVYFVAKVGIGTLLASRAGLDIGMQMAWPNPLTSVMVRAFVSMSLLVAFVALAKATRTGSSHRHIVLQCLVGAALLLVVNPISSPRYVFGTVALGLLTVAGGYATQFRTRIVGITILSALVFLFPMADAFRYGSRAEFKSDSPVGALTTGDFDAFGQLSNSLLYLQRHGSTDGQQALGVLFFWVPRDIWPSKPVDTGILLANSRGYTFTNLSSPLQAELLINGSWLALILGMFLLGWCARRADQRIRAALSVERSPGVLGCILPGYMFLILRGSLLQAMAYLAVILVTGMFVQSKSRGESRRVQVNQPRADVSRKSTFLAR